jgi:hypothetical protein
MNRLDETPTERRATLLQCAKVYLREARARRGSSFALVLRQWAANCRRDAAALDTRPAQGRLL